MHFSGNKAERTVKDFLKQPELIQEAIEQLGENEFLAESLFRGGWNAMGGQVAYMESRNRFMDDTENENLAIAEGSEFPEFYQSEEQQRANTNKYALSTWITFEDEWRNQLGALADAAVRIKNTMVRQIDGITHQVIRNHPRIEAVPATGATGWSPDSTTIFDDIFLAQEALEEPNNSGDVYTADTLLVSNRTYTNLLRNSDIRQSREELPPNYQPVFSGDMGMLAGLRILKSPNMTDNDAYVMQRGMLGGIADEIPFMLKPPERNEGNERIYLRAKRHTVAFVTNPGSILKITGVNA